MHEAALAVKSLSTGCPVVVTGVRGDHSFGHLVLAAEAANADSVAFLVRHSTGFLSVTMLAEDLDRLHLPPMCATWAKPQAGDVAVSVDAARGISTGISARDRATTVRTLADPRSVPDDLTRPGHVIPRRALDGGLLDRFGPCEGAIDLCVLSRCHPAAVVAALVNDDGSESTTDDLTSFADKHGLAVTSLSGILNYRQLRQAERLG